MFAMTEPRIDPRLRALVAEVPPIAQDRKPWTGTREAMIGVINRRQQATVEADRRRWSDEEFARLVEAAEGLGARGMFIPDVQVALSKLPLPAPEVKALWSKEGLAIKVLEISSALDGNQVKLLFARPAPASASSEKLKCRHLSTISPFFRPGQLASGSRQPPAAIGRQRAGSSRQPFGAP